MDRIRGARSHLAIGLMSGTSTDGIDAALVRLHQDTPAAYPASDHADDHTADARAAEDHDPGAGRTSFELIGFSTTPYPADVRERVMGSPNCSVRELVDLDLLLGRLFGDAAVSIAASTGFGLTDIDFVGSHGQTVFHRPPVDLHSGATLQIGAPEEIAERTGCIVVSGFRVRDVVLGGHGAPLVPLADLRLFGHPKERRVLLNIGGIANLTAVGPSPRDLVAFDVGPGNVLLDCLIRLATDGAAAFDRDGLRAVAGSPRRALLGDLLAHPFLALDPPRSADRLLFGEPMARRLLAEHAGVPLDDLLATAACFTADSVAAAIRGLGAPFDVVDRVIVSGGGVWNQAIMARLREQLAPIPVETSGDHGLPADAKEAVAFALLARETLLGRPGNLPQVTGARKAAILGQITA